MKNGVTKKDYEVTKLKVIDLFRTSPLNRGQIAELMSMTQSDVGTIIAESHTLKGDNIDGKFQRSEGRTPCMIRLEVLPRCYGHGCYWVKDGVSKCSAYKSMQAHTQRNNLQL